MKKAVLYVGNFILPDGNASGKRVLGNLFAIKDAGYHPFAFGFRKTDDNGLHIEEMYGLKSYSIPYCTGANRINNRIPYSYFLKIMDLIAPDYSIEMVIMYGSLGSVGFNKRVLKYCKRHSIKIVYDQVDLYDKPNRNNLLRYYYKLYEYSGLQRNIINKCDGAIVISSFLENRTQVPSIVVPPLAIKVSEPILKKTEEIVSIAYASYLSDKNRPVEEWKDRIDCIVDIAYRLLCENAANFQIKFIGFDECDLLDMFIEEEKSKYKEKLKTLECNVVFLGKCPNSIAQKEIACSDFTILIRDKKIPTEAGFPTKVSESIALGVPVISNCTSDIASYISDGENGVLLKDVDCVEENVEILKKVLSLSPEEINNMKRCCVKECKFDYSLYSSVFSDFIKNIEVEQ